MPLPLSAETSRPTSTFSAPRAGRSGPSRSLPPLLTRWIPGPLAHATRDVLISVTDYSPRRFWHTPGVYLTGLRLRLGWYAMPGAVGLWLWALPWARRSRAISVWSSEQDLRRFVRLPLPVYVMGRYRERGKLVSTIWKVEECGPTNTLERATRWIMDRSST
jgi:hypothetical protein